MKTLTELADTQVDLFFRSQCSAILDPSQSEKSIPAKNAGAVKECELLTIDLYGTFTAVRSDFNLPLKLIPTVVAN